MVGPLNRDSDDVLADAISIKVIYNELDCKNHFYSLLKKCLSLLMAGGYKGGVHNKLYKKKDDFWPSKTNKGSCYWSCVSRLMYAAFNINGNSTPSASWNIDCDTETRFKSIRKTKLIPN